ncbi:relaxase domain-containing protein [Nocardia sp. NBC_00565]|uniref:MobF family relaxase n=1 Tax=Nocardia sp. NBC_00565 TaxID=2975993 RepID=UPI002E808754|nr:MobF family relaxase [Nocardia sp. NBC_00565]WUC02021.1 relaxase domain-containing protein [Nocardia sp. NBC_00565]
MAATIHKLTAGKGFTYYLKHVAVHDASQTGKFALADYYSARGESPGLWWGMGLEALGLTAGSEVREDQMRALFGEGVHPEAVRIGQETFRAEITRGAKPKDAKRAALEAIRLGAPFAVYTAAGTFRERCAEEFVRHNRSRGLKWSVPIPDDVRAGIRTRVAVEMFTAEYARAPADERERSGWVARNSRPKTSAIAGFDVTFSPVKSISTLWAVTPGPIAAKIEAAHHGAVADALRYLEERVAYTRLGARGIRQVDVQGLISTAFTHRSSRAGDPDLHTHLVISNKVCVLETAEPEHELAGGTPRRQQWRTLDGRMLFRALVTISEIYNTRIEMRLEEALGLEFAARPTTDPDKRPVREVVGIDPSLMERWSARAAVITARLGELATTFQSIHGREPTATEMFQLAQQATLETRQAKPDARSRAEERADWRADAVDVLGGDGAIGAMVYAALHPRRRARPIIDADWISRTADQVVATVSDERATWQMTHVRSEAERIVRGQIPPSRWGEITDVIVAAALGPRRSIAIREPDRLHAPAPLRRLDGSSAYTMADSRLYTSSRILAAEARLIEMSQRTGARTVSEITVSTALLEYTANNPDRPLKAGQIGLIRGAATSEQRFLLGIAPAGSGKTTAMQILAQAWSAENGTVIGLAPNAAAAAVLGEKTGAPVATIDKITHTLDQHTPSLYRLPDDPAAPRPLVPGWMRAIGPDTLVIIDEIAQAGTFTLARAVSWLLSRGATVRGIGDHQQLAAVAAGGVVRDIMTIQEPLTLTELVRFRDETEAAASLALRDGDASALAFHADHGRIHVGAPDTVADSAYRAWAVDTAAGRDAVMLAPTHEIVATLNLRARTDRLARSRIPIGREVELSDGLLASVGDIIRTGENNPRLRISRSDYVRNGYRWVVTAVGPDGSVEAVHLRDGRKLGRRVVLPSEYLRSAVSLGYAGTIDSAQGTTSEICHGVLLGGESRQQLYVMATRGALANHIWIATTLDGTNQSLLTERAAVPRTAIEILIEILSRDGTQKSATTMQREAMDPLIRFGPLVDTYTDALGALAEHALGPAALEHIERSAARLLPGLTDAPAWPTLRQHLATVAVTGDDPVAALDRAISYRDFDDAVDVAAVLDWRLDTTGNHSTDTGPLPWLPGIPLQLRTAPDNDQFFGELTDRLTLLTDRIRTISYNWTSTTAPRWASALLDLDRDLVADLAVWRAARRVPDTDHRPIGPSAVPNRQRTYQHALAGRVRAMVGASNRAASRWAGVADTINTRIADDPYWPVLAEHLDSMHRAGIDVPTHMTTAAKLRPLPDEQPAAALWWRLHRHLNDAGMYATGLDLHRPQWLSELREILGTALATSLIDDPAWPRLVTAVESVDPTVWRPHDLLSVAATLIHDNQLEPSDDLESNGLCDALAARIEAIHHHTAISFVDVASEPSSPEDDERAAATVGVFDPEANLAPPHMPTESPSPSYPASAPADTDEDYLAAVIGVATTDDDEWHFTEDPVEMAQNWTMEQLRRYGAAGLEKWKPGARYPDLTPAQRVAQLTTDMAEQQRVLDQATDALRNGTSPNMKLGMSYVLGLRARSDAQRPFRIAAEDANQEWIEADRQAELNDTRYRDLVAEVARDTSHLDHADELEALAKGLTDGPLKDAVAEIIGGLRAQTADGGTLIAMQHAKFIAENSAAIAEEAGAKAAEARQALTNIAGPEGPVTELAIIEARFMVEDVDQLAVDTAKLELERTQREFIHAQRQLRAGSITEGETEAAESNGHNSATDLIEAAIGVEVQSSVSEPASSAPVSRVPETGSPTLDL